MHSVISHLCKQRARENICKCMGSGHWSGQLLITKEKQSRWKIRERGLWQTLGDEYMGAAIKLEDLDLCVTPQFPSGDIHQGRDREVTATGWHDGHVKRCCGHRGVARVCANSTDSGTY